MAMSLTLQDSLKVNNEKAINDVGREVLKIANEIIIKPKGVPVLVKFNMLSDKDKWKYFTDPQINEIKNLCPLKDMDVSLLHANIRAFGRLPPGRLNTLLRNLKEERNIFEHGKHKLLLDKKELKIRLDNLKAICIDILNELKVFDPSQITDLDDQITVTEGKFLSLERTIDEEILENTNKLIHATGKAVKTIINMEHAGQDICTKTADAATTITQMECAALDISNKTAKAATTISQMECAALDISNKTAKAATTISQMEGAALDISNKTAKAATTISQMEGAALDISNKTANVATTITQMESAALDISNKTAATAIAQMEQFTHFLKQSLSDAIPEQKHKKWDESEVLASAQIEVNQFISLTCKVQTAEWLEKSVKTSPMEIMTEFLVLRIRKENFSKRDCPETEQTQYQLVLEMRSESGKLYDIILLTGDAGMGKTTFMKYIGWVFKTDPKLIKRLSEHNFLIYYECRNSLIKCIDDLLKFIFPKTPKNFSMDFEDFKTIIMQQNLLIIIDGYDEVNSDTKKVVDEILQLRNKRIIISTRPGSLRRITRLVPGDKEAVTLELQGIQPSQYEDFVMKLLRLLIPDEEKRKKVCKELVRELHEMIPTFGTFLNCPMILNHLTYLKVEEPVKMKFLTNNTEVYEAIRDLKIRKALKRMEGKVSADTDLDDLIPKFMNIYDAVAVKTYVKSQYELPKEIVLELENECKNIGLPHEEILPTFLSLYTYHDGSLPCRGYKYHHRTEQEFSFAKYLGMLVEKDIMNNSSQVHTKILEITNILKENIIWNYMTDSITENEIKQNKSELSRYRNIIFFLIGEMARLSKSKTSYLTKIFENLSDKLINIGWHSTESIEWSNICYGGNDNTDKTGNHDSDNRKDDETDIREEIKSSNVATELNMSNSMEIKESVESNIDSNKYVETKKDDEEENNDELSSFGKEDLILRYLVESKMDMYMTESVISKLSRMKYWKITNGQSFLALNHILPSVKPEKIAILLESDPLIYPELHKTISALAKKQIPFELFLNSHYTNDVVSVSNDWIESNLPLVEFCGRVDRKGMENLPNCLTSLHIGVDYTDLPYLNTKIKDLKELTVLGIRIDISKDIEVERLPKLSYTGDVLCLTLVYKISNDMDFCLLASHIAKQLCPDTRNGWLNEIWLQNTCLTGQGIEQILTELHDFGISIHGMVKIWSTAHISPDEYKKLDLLAKSYDLGGLQVYNKMSLEELMPKTMINISRETNLINTD
ncbi:unnamed protein product, partial [Meganyctiphanes norvegica]